MADSDRSRSTAPGRNRADPHERSPPQLRPDLPFFPRWRGPMQASMQQAQNMSRPQFRPQLMMNQPGAYMNWSMFHPNWSGHQFRPAPPSLLHRPYHIHDLHVRLTHHAHKLFHAHLPNRALRAPRRSHHPNLVASIHRPALHRRKRTTKKLFELMGLIPLHNGRTTRTITTTKRSMD